MNYYEFSLPNTNVGQRAAKRVFLLIAAFHFVTGLGLMILALCIYWRFVFLPLIWFLMGFVYGNIAYLFVTDYRYVYDHGVFTVLRHRRFGRYRPVVSAPVGEMSDSGLFAKTKQCTNSPQNYTFVYENVQYIVTIDDYMLSLLKGETHDIP